MNSGTNDIDKVIEILIWIKNTVTPDTNLLWTPYNTHREILDELEMQIKELKEGKTEILEKLRTSFLPTCTFQELAISNGWGDYYLELAEKFDETYKRIKNCNGD